MLEWKKSVYKEEWINENCYTSIYATSIMKLAHAKLNTLTSLVRKSTNDKAREHCVIAREYQRQKEIARRKS